MAKALMGHMATDHHLVSEVARLRARVRVLESELTQLRERSEYGAAEMRFGQSVRVDEVALSLENHGFDASERDSDTEYDVTSDRATPALA